MSAELTRITELATAIGVSGLTLDQAAQLNTCPIHNVDTTTWRQLIAQLHAEQHRHSFLSAWNNGRAFNRSSDGLDSRIPRHIEWKGPHRIVGDDVIPSDLRVDRVYLISCKYLSKVMFNASPQRVFERNLAGDIRSGSNWFSCVAPDQLQDLYRVARSLVQTSLPANVNDLSKEQQRELKRSFVRTWPNEMSGPWNELCRQVSEESTRRWRSNLGAKQQQLRLVWRLLRLGAVSYFILGTDKNSSLRLRVDSTWDWSQRYQLKDFQVAARHVGQPEVGWEAAIHDNEANEDITVSGHVEIRWSHGRFVGAPEAKGYLDSRHLFVPGYHKLAHSIDGSDL